MTLFVGVGTAAAVFTADIPAQLQAARQVLLPAVFGLMITVMVFAVGDVSGANLNPAVSLGLLIARKMSLLRFAAYWTAQVIGASAGSAYVYSLDPDAFRAAGVAGAANILSYNPAGGSGGLWRVIGAEMLGTYLLVFTVMAAADVGREQSTKYVGAMTPLAIGIAVLLAHVFLIPIDGCSINPARSFGSAAVAGQWAYHWVFWAGPCAGAAAAALTWEALFKGPSVPYSRRMAGYGRGGQRVALPSPGYTGVGRTTSFMSDTGSVAGPADEGEEGGPGIARMNSAGSVQASPRPDEMGMSGEGGDEGGRGEEQPSPPQHQQEQPHRVRSIALPAADSHALFRGDMHADAFTALRADGARVTVNALQRAMQQAQQNGHYHLQQQQQQQQHHDRFSGGGGDGYGAPLGAPPARHARMTMPPVLSGSSSAGLNGSTIFAGHFGPPQQQAQGSAVSTSYATAFGGGSEGAGTSGSGRASGGVVSDNGHIAPPPLPPRRRSVALPDARRRALSSAGTYADRSDRALNLGGLSAGGDCFDRWERMGGGGRGGRGRGGEGPGVELPAYAASLHGAASSSDSSSSDSSGGGASSRHSGVIGPSSGGGAGAMPAGSAGAYPDPSVASPSSRGSARTQPMPGLTLGTPVVLTALHAPGKPDWR